MARNDATPAGRLLDLLADERRALLSGDLAALPAYIVAKETLVAAVEAAAPDQTMLERLKKAAASNQALLDAALRGVRAARARIDVARNGGATLNTYDAKGKSATYGATRPSFERRA